jgi:hypothetical protein
LNRPKGLPTFVYRRFVGGALPDRNVLKKEKNGDGLNVKTSKSHVMGNKTGGTGAE